MRSDRALAAVAALLGVVAPAVAHAAPALSLEIGGKSGDGISTDVVGYLCEVLSGQRLDDFLQERILGPLGMVDTGFAVPAEDVERFAAWVHESDAPLRANTSSAGMTSLGCVRQTRSENSTPTSPGGNAAFCRQLSTKLMQCGSMIAASSSEMPSGILCTMAVGGKRM